MEIMQHIKDTFLSALPYKESEPSRLIEKVLATAKVIEEPLMKDFITINGSSSTS